MSALFTTRVSILIHAPASRIWQALTDPNQIQQYLFGARTVTDWKVGSLIKWEGEWQGKPYEDKGTVLKFVPEKLIETTYWSSKAGMPDSPANYKRVTYELTQKSSDTLLTLTQDNNASEEERDHSEQNWKMVLDGLKKLVER